MKKAKSENPPVEITSSASSAETPEAVNSSENFLIVGIGASAGGIKALKCFFENVPADSGVAYVVILHLSPDHDSQLASVLQTVSPIPVQQVTERVKVEPDKVYVVPPNEHLEMLDGTIIVSPNLSVEERRAPVDIFFRTLAYSHQSRAVAVILSGTGANGSMGIKRIKERGGAAFVQNPREAEFDEMPRNSMATGLIDRVSNVADIPPQIIAYKNSIGAVEIPIEAEQRPEDAQQALREIFTQLRLRTGHDFSNYKRPTILRRIERRINVFDLPDLASYAQILRDNADEARALLKDLLISVTNFFRDKQSFQHLETIVMPKIFRGKRAQDQVRIWVCGCATGEEAYTLAMLCSEQTLGIIDAPAVQIFATDIDEQAIAVAREGFYTLNDAADVSPERLRRFFVKEADGYRVRRELREMILFADHNVIKDPPFSRLDLTTCRNMLIYLNQTAQERVMETFHFALNPGGFLFLGNSESVDGAGDLFATESKENRIYQSRTAAARFTFPVSELSRSNSRSAGRNIPANRFVLPAPDPRTRAERQVSFGDLHQRLIEQYAPPSIVVNAEYDIVHLSERAGRFLQIAGGEPSKNLLKLIRPELRLELRTALYQAVQKHTNVEVKNLKIRLDERVETINLYARPVLIDEERETSLDEPENVPPATENSEPADAEPELSRARGFILVVLETVQANGGERGENSETVYTPHEPVTRQLEELLRTKLQLRQTVEQFEIQAEEFKASNEELQAINEELRSAAEELETSREELQSVNEELTTVNQELKIKIEEVTQTRNDYQNLINSTEIATIFLDRNFRVKTFTPAASRIFNLLPTDEGRPLTDITNILEDARLLEAAQTVLESLQTVERLSRSTVGGIYLMRALPYRTAEDRIIGVVMTFFDITDQQQAEESKAFLAAIVESADDAMLTVNFDGVITSWNTAAQKLYGYSSREAVGKPLTMLALPEDLREILANAERIKRGETVQTYETVRLHQGGRHLDLEISLSPVKNHQNQIIGVSTIARDVTERKLDRASLQESEERFRAMFEQANVGIVQISADGQIIMPNRGFCEIIGYAEEEMRRLKWRDITHPDDYRREAKLTEKLRAGKIPGFSIEKRYIRKDGSIVWGKMTTTLVRRQTTREPLFALVVVEDITEKKLGEEALRESEARFRNMADHAPVMIWITEPDAACTYLSQSWYEFTGQTPETGLGLGWLDATHPDDRAKTEQIFLAASVRREAFRLEYRLRRADGTYAWAIDSAQPRFSDAGEFLGYIGSVIDISERKRAEETLRESEERLRLTTEAAEMYSWEFDIETDTYKFSGNAARILGVDPENLPLTNQDAARLVHPEDLEKTQATLRRALRTGDGFALELRSIKKSGETIWLDVQTTVLKNDEGAPMRVIGITQNITGRKKVEEIVRESEERMRLATEAAEMGTWEWNLLTDQVFWNKRHFELFGMKTRKNPLDAGLFFKHVHPDDRARVAAALKKAIAEKSIFNTDFRAVLEDGGVRWMSGYGRVVEISDDGVPLRMSGVMLDITERKRVEAELNANEERLRTIFEASRDGILVEDDERIVYVNESYARMFGYDAPEDLIGNFVSVTIAPEDVARLIDYGKRRAAGTISANVYEFKGIKKDGTVFEVEASVSASSVGGRTYITSIVRDVTRRKLAQEALRLSEERLRLLIESPADYAIFTLTIGGLIDSWNAGAEKLFGWTEAEVLGKPNEILFTPEEREKGEAEQEIEIARQKGRAPDERFYLRKDGSRFYASGVMTVLKNDAGAVLGFVKISRDMTERIEAEKALREKDMLRKLVGAQEEERKRIARDLHDELGQQLTALRLKLDVARKLCENENELCGKIDEIEMIAKSIDNGVDYLAWELRPAALDHLGLVAALENYVKQWSHYTGVTAELIGTKLKRARLAPEIETNLYRIVQEALNNTLKHAKAKRVDIMLEKRDNLIILVIEDDGAGFNLQAKKKRPKGMGLLGMQERAQLIGGELEIESAPKSGTTIYVRVPVASKKQEQQ